MSDSSVIRQSWVASGSAGAVGSIHRVDAGFIVRLLAEHQARGPYPSLDVAKSALHSALGPGADRPEFIEHG